MTAMAVPASSLRPVRVEGMGMDEAVGEEQVPRLSRGQTAAVMLSVCLGVVVAGYGMVGSYVAVSELAARHDVPLAGWVPAGLDGGLVAVVVLDLALTWIGTPVGWLRQLVRVLSAGTVVANAVAGWPHRPAPPDRGSARHTAGTDSTRSVAAGAMAHAAAVAADGAVADHQLPNRDRHRAPVAARDDPTPGSLRVPLKATRSGRSGVDAAYWRRCGRGM